MDISSSEWDIFLIFSGYILGMLVHLLQMILIFTFVCRSVCLLTSLPELDRGISPVLDEISYWIFWRHSWHVGTFVPNNSDFLFVCQSGSWHTSLPISNRFRDISSSRWNIFLNFYGHIPGMLVHLFQINPNS